MSGGFGIYVHWPYCTAICPYCDFNVYRARHQDNDALLGAIEADITAHAERFGKRQAQSIFLGGGTPSLLRGAEIERLIATCARAYDITSDCEITLECNPEDAALLAEQVSAGINRVSIGVQSLDDAALKALGRRHSSASALHAVAAAEKTGARVSLDLIYAREGQSVDAWRAELARALALPAEHVSLYQLTIEPDTAFARKVARGALTPPDADAAAELYKATQEECERAGFTGYEISNHARSPGARARHNLIYWRGGDWLGVGPGAHGRVTYENKRYATEAHRRPADYIDAVRENGFGWLSETPLTNEESADELLIMGLRIDEGVQVARLNALRAKPIDPQALAWLEEQGFVTLNDGRVRLTALGKPLANKIAAEIAF
ncbi:radical SAM family enzyme [alpha proteobacterium U9-1i]|nr:radical SAM family enzyme [alpha proteobacterium U9-1i]